jgi:hypothetical protein
MPKNNSYKYLLKTLGDQKNFLDKFLIAKPPIKKILTQPSAYQNQEIELGG